MKLYLEPKRHKISEIQKRAALLKDIETADDVALILRSYLEVAPLHFDARQLVRRIEIEHRESVRSNVLDHALAGIRISLSLVSAGKAMEEAPVMALTHIEEALELDVFSTDANLHLAEVGKKLSNPRMVALAYETLLRAQPENLRWYSELAHAYMADSNYADAVDVYNELLELQPENQAAKEGLQAAQDLLHVEVNKDFSESDEDDWGRHQPEQQFDIQSEIRGGRTGPASSFETNATLPKERGFMQDPLEDIDRVLSFVAHTLECVEKAAISKPEKLSEWLEWTESIAGERLEELQREITTKPDEAELRFELGVLQIEMLQLPEAREAISRCAELQPEIKPVCYALMALILLHESILHRPAAGPSLQDFAWFV